MIVVIVILVILFGIVVELFKELFKDKDIVVLEKGLSKNYNNYEILMLDGFGGGEGQRSGDIAIAKSGEKYIIAQAYKENLFSSDIEYSQIEFETKTIESIEKIFEDCLYFYKESNENIYVMLLIKCDSKNEVKKYKEKIVTIANELDKEKGFWMKIFISPDDNVNTDNHKALLLRHFLGTPSYKNENINILNPNIVIDRDFEEEKSINFYEEEFNKAFY